MSWKDTVNRGLSRSLGYELRRVGQPEPRRRAKARTGERLVPAPAFVLSTVRSGSTLLRVVLDSHPDIFAPHELHLRDIDVALASTYVERSLAEAGLDAEGLRFLLWDRLLHRELAASGKTQLVNKTPNDVFIADRILACWPDARFIFLLRHPGAIERSRQETRPQDTPERNAEMVRRYGDALEAARRTYPGLTIRYEDLAGDPERTTREVCAFLGLEWTADMLEYGRFDHGRMKPGLGDWKDNIKSGRVQPPAPPPAEVHEELRHLVEAWGYATDARPAADAPA
jgi:hypothetical protein